MSNASSTREAALTRSAEPFDLIVVGGGCNGAGTAWDAAARGMRVLLLEKEMSAGRVGVEQPASSTGV